MTAGNQELGVRSQAGPLCPAPDRQLPTREVDAGYTHFVAAMHDLTGINLASYKPDQTRRRVQGLLSHCEATGFSDYLHLLERDPARLRQFRDFLTINVSEFFRSPDRFAVLRETVLPRLLAGRTPLRVWSAGCSYGAEAYSLAILLEELTPGVRHEILATDIDERSLARAELAADFVEQDVRHVSSRERYFAWRGGRLSLDPALAARVTFRSQDLLTGNFEGDFDLIVCRNVMIYFTREAKGRLAGAFHAALRPGGYVFCGSSEALRELPEAGFTPEAVGFYRKGEKYARS